MIKYYVLDTRPSVLDFVCIINSGWKEFPLLCYNLILIHLQTL